MFWVFTSMSGWMQADHLFQQRLHDVEQAGNGVLDLSQIALDRVDPETTTRISTCAGIISTLKLRHVDFSAPEALACFRSILAELTASHRSTMATLDLTQAHHALCRPVVDLVVQEALGKWWRLQHVHVDGCTGTKNTDNGLERLATAVVTRIPLLKSFTAVHAARDVAHERKVRLVLGGDDSNARVVRSRVSCLGGTSNAYTVDYDEIHDDVFHATLFLTD